MNYLTSFYDSLVMRSGVYQQLEKEKSQLSEQAGRLTQQVSGLEMKLAATETDKTKLQKTNANLQEQNTNLTQQKQKYESQLQDYQTEISLLGVQLKRHRRLTRLREKHLSHEKRTALLYSPDKLLKQIKDLEKQYKIALAYVIAREYHGMPDDFKKALNSLRLRPEMIQEIKALNKKVNLYETNIQQILDKALAKAQLEALEPIFPMMLDIKPRAFQKINLGYYVNGNLVYKGKRFDQALGRLSETYGALEDIFQNFEVDLTKIYSEDNQQKKHGIIFYHYTTEKEDKERGIKTRLEIYRMELKGNEAFLIFPARIKTTKPRVEEVQERRSHRIREYIKHLAERISNYRSLLNQLTPKSLLESSLNEAQEPEKT